MFSQVLNVQMPAKLTGVTALVVWGATFAEPAWAEKLIGPIEVHSGSFEKPLYDKSEILTKENSICTLTQVQGRFDTGDEFVRLEVNTTTGHWVMTSHEDARASAYCLRFK